MKNVVKLLSVSLLVSGVMFSSCRKDAEEMKSEHTRNLKSGNYQQPTQNIDIITVITIDGVDYPVTGSAVVGSYDGRIYECNAAWTMFAGTDVIFTATLKAQYHNIMIPVEPAIDNYTITVSNGLTETSAEIADLWASIVAFCNENVVLSDMFPIARLTNANEIEHLFLQRDVQEYFASKNPNATLVFVEVTEDGTNGQVGLLFRVYYEENNAVETSFSLVLNLVGNTYCLALPGSGGGGGMGGGGASGNSVSCKTSDSDCVESTHGCTPWGDSSCNKCPKTADKCEKTVTNSIYIGTTTAHTAYSILSEALYYAVSAYAAY